MDTRLITSRDDAKAAAAAVDDSRTALRELLAEGPALPGADRLMLENDVEVLTTAMARIDAVAGHLTRLIDRWQS